MKKINKWLDVHESRRVVLFILSLIMIFFLIILFIGILALNFIKWLQ